MKFAIADSSGNIIRTVDVIDTINAFMQVDAANNLVYKLPDGTGLVDDGQLMVVANALALKPGITASSNLQYLGLALTILEPPGANAAPGSPT